LCLDSDSSAVHDLSSGTCLTLQMDVIFATMGTPRTLKF
jgi:hypothetical protein